MLSTERRWFSSSAGSSSYASTIDAGRDEARDVVDVAVRVVADAALAEPDRLADAEVVAEDALVVRRGRARDCAPARRRAATPR